MIKQRPLLLPFVAMAAGLAVTDQTGYHLPVSAVAAALLCLLLSAQVRSRTILEIGVPLFFFVLGLYALSPWKTPATPPGSIWLFPSSLPLTLQGIVTSRPTISAAGTSLVVRTEQLFRAGRPEVASGNLLLVKEMSACCEATGSASQRGFRCPGDSICRVNSIIPAILPFKGLPSVAVSLRGMRSS
jgi:hypothetical protein